MFKIKVINDILFMKGEANMNQEKIGKFIAEMRKEKKLTQEELASQLNITKNAVSKWERGISLMDISLLKTLSTALGVEVIDILSGEIVDKNNKDEQFEKMILDIFNNINLNKKKIKRQYYLFEIIILILTISILTLSHSEIINILVIILMVVANTFNLSFYVLSKDVVLLLGKVKKDD